MYRVLVAIFAFIFSIVIFAGCSGVLSKIFAKQELSKNYAQLPDTTATSPEMIDGDLKTFGQSAFSAGTEYYYGGTAPSEAIVTLPEEKLIRKVVIYSNNLKTLDILADKGDGDWEILKEIKSFNVSPLEVSVSPMFKTDRIMLRVHSTTDDAVERRRQSARWIGGRRIRGAQGAPANIHEIELYGYATKEEMKAKEEKNKKEDIESELDRLLE